MKKRHLQFLFICTFLLSISIIQAQTVFVKADAAGNADGTSWADAYTDLSVAIDSAQAGNELWVAAGTYLPGGMAADTNSFFILKNDVALYGGFAGTETMLSERDYENNLSILSGDLLGNDMPMNTANNREDNVKHIFFVDASITNTAVVDGFVFSGGHAKNNPAGGDTRRGGAMLTYGAPVIRNCTFTNNFGWFAGGVYPRGGAASGFVVDNCVFDSNNSGFGGAMAVVSTTSGTVSNCSFINNTTAADNRGGAIYDINGSCDFINCEFTDNICFRTGGAIHLSGDPLTVVNVDNCSFTNNQATWGGAITTYGDTTQLNVSNSTFSNNSAMTAGGAMSNGFKAIVSIDSCEFMSNKAENSGGTGGVGGAIFTQNDTTKLSVSNSFFQSNSSIGSGGAFVTGFNSPTSFTSCRFETNQGDVGGAINYSPDIPEIAPLTVSDCIFLANIAATQGGALNIGNADATIVNTLFDTNIANAIGTGGAISNNGSASQNSTVNIMNSTFANNFGALAAGIAQWTDSDTSFATVTLQNTIFQNIDGDNYVIEDGFPTVVSNGGNLSADATMDTVLTGTNDLTGALVNPLFVDLYDSDYHLMALSPCINTGISAGAPTLDIEGNPRVGEVDMGAYEFQGVVSTVELVDNSALSFSPNPADVSTLLQLDNDWRGPLQLRIYDNSGKLAAIRVVQKNSKVLNHSLNVAELSAGAYRLVIISGKEMMSKTLVKI